MLDPDKEQEKRQILGRYRSLISAIRPEKEDDKELVKKAFQFAAEAHSTMRRKTGEPYIFHPIEVARIVAIEIGLDTTSVVCALLHDVVEDTEFSIEDIKRMFGKKVALIIDGLTKIEDIFDQSSTSIQAENFKKMLFTISDDVRVILIKLADRLHNMRTLDAMPKTKRLRAASETIYFYAPLAHRFGLYSIKTELEDLSLKYTEPEVYSNIAEKLRESAKERTEFIEKFNLPIQKSLLEQKFNFRMLAREKSVFSIWQKMRKKGIPFEEVDDIFAVRIIIDTPKELEKVDCWRVYSVVTDHYRPNIDRLRDWISIPRANGYEALHTTVMSKNGKWVEVQIRTERMEEIAEKGLVAHWHYKSTLKLTEESNVSRWLDRIREIIVENDSNAIDFLDDFQGFLFTDEIFVFTPKGELRNLPANSTVLDLAYAIHTDLGNTCIGAKVNHKLTPLDHILNSGDQVEIITSQKQIPKGEWYGYVETTRARTQIKRAIKDQKKKFSKQGKEKLKKYFNQLNIEYTKENLSRIRQKYNHIHPEDLYYEVATNLNGLKEVRSAIQNNIKGSWFGNLLSRPFRSKGEKETLSETIIRHIDSSKQAGLSEEEVSKMSYEVSDCCNPIPGDEIVGFIEPFESIYIHRANCQVAISQFSKFSNRIVKTIWRDRESIGFLAGVKVYGIDNKGFIKEIIKVITENLDMNVKSFHLETKGGIIEAVIKVYVYSTGNLNNLIVSLGKLKNVKKVHRIEAKTDEEIM